LSDDVLNQRKAEIGLNCGTCGHAEKSQLMQPDHIVPLGVGGADIQENIQFLCNRCQYMRKFTIRIPGGLANQVLHSTELPISELIRVALTSYFDKHSRDDGLEIINLKQQNRVLRARLDAVKKAFDYNPFEEYIRNKD
jgi:hypothetical protein